MSAIFILISASIIIALGFLAAFIWSVKNGQFDDDYTPSVRILFENKQIPGKEIEENNKNTNPSLCNSKNSATTIKL